VPDAPSGPAGGKGPDSYVPKPRFDYKAPSFLWEHRYLAVIFAIVLIAVCAYLYRVPHKKLVIEPPPPPPVYVEPVR
jgi:hypothetical protein